MGKRTTTERTALDLDEEQLGTLVARTSAALGPEDGARVQALVSTVLELTRRLRHREASIAGLRRFFGISHSEKLASIVDQEPQAQGQAQAQAQGQADVSPEGRVETELCAASGAAGACSGESRGECATVGLASETPCGASAAAGDVSSTGILGRQSQAPQAERADAESSGVAAGAAAAAEGDCFMRGDETLHGCGGGSPGARSDAAGAGGQTAPRRRKGHGRLAASQYRKAVIHEVPHETLKVGDRCALCARGTLYALAEPAVIVRIVGGSLLSARCWRCQRLRCGGCGAVFTAKAPEAARGPKYDDTAVVAMALFRYGGGMASNRLSCLQRNLETPVPASTQWEVTSARSRALAPILDALELAAANADLLHTDDTHVRILGVMGKRRAKLAATGLLPSPDRTGLFTTAMVAVIPGGRRIALFASGRQHAGENLAHLLARRVSDKPAPVHMADGLERNAPKGHAVLEANCLPHGRRHIVDEVTNFPAECRHVLEQLGAVFHNDALCAKQGLSPEERLLYHQRHSGPIMADLAQWLEAELEDKRVERNSGLGKAYAYLLKRWQALTLFLRVAGAPLDNNLCERVLKMAIRHRNNSLFYRSERGAAVGDLYMSLIFTAELCGINPYDYLLALLRHEDLISARPTDWLPWTYQQTLAQLAGSGAAPPPVAVAA